MNKNIVNQNRNLGKKYRFSHSKKSLAKISDIITNLRLKNRVTIYLDVEKTFDKINYEILQKTLKMQEFKSQPYFY